MSQRGISAAQYATRSAVSRRVESGPHEYARFAASFREVRNVSVLPAPGFLPRERFPKRRPPTGEDKSEHKGDNKVLPGREGAVSTN